MSVSSRVGATSEAQAADELVAVLADTLPCQQYAIAWLDDTAGRIKYRCLTTSPETEFVAEQRDRLRVYYSLDMRPERDRFAKVYRSRGTPTPPIVLAQFLHSIAMLAAAGLSHHRHLAPLVVYSRNILSPTATLFAVPRTPIAPEVMVLPP